MEYHLRIRATCLSDVGVFESFLKEKADEYTFGYEIPVDNPDNPHYQGYLKTRYADITIRKAITKMLTASGNRAYSLTKLKKDKSDLLQYVCKDLDIRYTTLSAEELEVYKQIGSSRKAEMEAKVQKRQQQKTALQKMMDDPRIMDAGTREETFAGIVRWYVEKYKCIPEVHVIRRMVQTIMLRRRLNSNPKYFEERLKLWAAQVYSRHQSPGWHIEPDESQEEFSKLNVDKQHGSYETEEASISSASTPRFSEDLQVSPIQDICF